jgi:iron(III) transport system permease protein
VLIAPAAVGAIIAFAPLVYLAIRSTEQGWGAFWAEIARPQTRSLLRRSATISVSATIACTLIGVGAAWLVTMTNVIGRRVWETLLALPLAVPTYVAAYTWLGTFDNPNPFFGAWGVMVACSYPYVYLPVLAALRRVDQQQLDVARSLGVRPAQVFWRVTLPQIRPAMTSGALLVALYALSDFGAVSLMRYETMTQGIYLSYVGSFDRTPAAILGVLLVAVTAVVVTLEMRSRGAANRIIASARGTRRKATPLQLGRLQVPALLGLGSLIGIALGIPCVALTRWFVANNALDLALLWSTLWSTLLVAALGAVACTFLAVPIALLSARFRTRTSVALEATGYLGHALPGLVIALAMVFIGVRFLNPIYQRIPLLVLAYVALFLPLAVAAARTSFAQAPPLLEDVGRSLGATPVGVLRRITLRIASPGIAAGGALVALTCIKELPATLLLRPTGFDTLATRLWTETGVADYGAAAPYAVAMLVVGAIPMAILNRTER